MGRCDHFVRLTVFVVVGIALTSGQCQTNQTLIAEINATVAGFQAQLNQIMSSGLPQDQQNAMIFNIACFNETYAPQVNMIAMAIANCPLIATTTNLGSLMFGPIGFTQIFLLFPQGGLQEFCNCSTYLTGALALEAMKTNYKLSVMNGQYPHVGNLGFFCNENMAVPQGMPINIRMMLNMTLMGLDMSCPRIYELAGMANSMQAMKVRNYLSMCPMFNQTAFQCTIDASKSTAFKNCVNGVTGDNNNEIACATYDCMVSHISSGSGNCGTSATMEFIRALDIELSANNTMVRDNDDGCENAAQMIALSLTSLIASLLLVFIF